MLEEIKKIIEANLPAQMAGVLRDFIQESEARESSFKELQSKYDKLKLNFDDLASKNRKFDDLVSRETKVFDKEQALWIREKDQEIDTMKIKVEEAEKRAELSKELVKTVFSNPTLSYRENGWMPVKDPNGYTQNGSFDRTITSSVTK